MSHDIKQPPVPRNQHKARGCLAFVDGRLTYFINPACRRVLLWDFWFNYARSPVHEDPALPNDYFAALTGRDDWVPYSETILIREEDVADRDQQYPLGYRRLPDRLDFYVTKEEFRQAFLALQRLGRRKGTGRVLEVRIFGSVRVVLLEEEQFSGKASEAAPPAPT